MRLLRRIGILCLLCAGSATAAELVPVRDGDRLGAHVRGLQFPPDLAKDLRSGLTNRVLLRLELLAESRVVETRAIEIAVKYDLWDETFRVTTTPAQGAGSDRVLATEQQVLAILSDVALPRLFELPRLPAAREHGMRCDVLVNPIEQERLALIRKWVAENSTPTAGGAEAGANGPVAAAASVDLFNRIFEQYSSGGGGAAAWRTTLQSRPFRPDAVPSEGANTGQGAGPNAAPR